MSRLRRPLVWLPLVYLALVVGGAIGLAQPFATQTSERDRNAYAVRHWWNSTFDALSATCGVGLLVRNFDLDFTDNGRRMLVGLGVVSTIVTLIAFMQILKGGGGASPHLLPPVWLVVLLLLLLQAFPIGIAWFNAAGGSTPLFAELYGMQALAAFNGLGWPQAAPRNEAWILALIGLIGAVGWPVWLLIAWPVARRSFEPRRVLLALLGYAGFLVLLSTLMTVSETPRGFRGQSGPNDSLAAQPVVARFERCSLQVCSAAGAGRATEPLSTGGISEASKLILASVAWVGGFFGPPSGGVTWLLFLFALRRPAARGAIQAPESPGQSTDFPFTSLAARVVIGMAVLTLVVILGLLCIESRVASRFQSAPTLGDAALDAASLVGGANLTSGLARTISDPNLSSGMFQNVDLYQYGMGFMALAMIVGRFLPLVVLARHARSISGGRLSAPARRSESSE